MVSDLFFRHRRIIDCVVETARFFPLLGLPHDEVAYVDDVSELADLARCLRAFEESFGFLVKDVESVPGAVEAEVAAHDAYIGTHYL